MCGHFVDSRREDLTEEEEEDNEEVENTPHTTTGPSFITTMAKWRQTGAKQ